MVTMGPVERVRGLAQLLSGAAQKSGSVKVGLGWTVNLSDAASAAGFRDAGALFARQLFKGAA